MYLFFDTETTGLPKRWDAPVTEVDNWPRLVQLAWANFDEEGKELSRRNLIVRPDGFEIPAESVSVHRISNEKAQQEGIDLKDALEQFATDVEAAQFLIGHNVSFDEAVVGAEFIRTGIPHQLWHRERICTKLESTDFVAIPGKYGYKWPTLVELHQKLFGEGVDGLHDAMVDVEATARCFFALKRIGVV